MDSVVTSTMVENLHSHTAGRAVSSENAEKSVLRQGMIAMPSIEKCKIMLFIGNYDTEQECYRCSIAFETTTTAEATVLEFFFQFVYGEGG